MVYSIWYKYGIWYSEKKRPSCINMLDTTDKKTVYRIVPYPHIYMVYGIYMVVGVKKRPSCMKYVRHDGRFCLSCVETGRSKMTFEGLFLKQK